MRFVFVMDSLDRVSHDKDTTFAFIDAAQARGHESLHCHIHDLSAVGGEVFANVHPVVITEQFPFIALLREKGPHRVALSDVDAVFIRKDPPFDQAYLYATLSSRTGPRSHPGRSTIRAACATRTRSSTR
jgi:glutathione synthase